MKKILAIVALLISITGYADSVDVKYSYIGSFYNEWYTDHPAHYIEELWLWKSNDNDVIGLYIEGAAFGGRLNPTTFEITKSKLEHDGRFSFSTKKNSFIGKLTAKKIEGELKTPGDDWEGRDLSKTFFNGSKIDEIINPKESIKTRGDFKEWLESIDELH